MNGFIGDRVSGWHIFGHGQIVHVHSGKGMGGGGMEGQDPPLFFKINFVILPNPMRNCWGEGG